MKSRDYRADPGFGAYRRPRKAPDRGTGKGPSSPKQAKTKAERQPKVKVSLDLAWNCSGLTVSEEHCALILKFSGLDNWNKCYDNAMRHAVVDIGIKIEGHVETFTSHARLPVDFNFGRTLCQRAGESVVSILPGMRDGDVEQFKDCLAGENYLTLSGNRQSPQKYAEGQHRASITVSGPESTIRIRVHAEPPRNLQSKNLACYVVVCLKNSKGSHWTLQDVYLRLHVLARLTESIRHRGQ